MKKSDLFFSIILIPIDLVSILVGFVIAYYVRKHIDNFDIVYIPSLWEYLEFVSYFLPIWIFVFAMSGLYSVKNTRKIGFAFQKTFIAVPTALMIFVTAMFFIKEAFFSRLIVVYSLVLIIALTIFFRLLIYYIRKLFYHHGIGINKVLVIGTGKIGKEIIKYIEQHPGRGYKVIGVIKTDERMENPNAKSQIVGFLPDIGSVVAKMMPDEIIQTEPLTPKENLNIVHLCEDKRITFRFIPSLFALYSRNNDSDTMGKIPVLEVKRSNLDGWGRIVKRMIDIFGALFGIIISLPIQIIIALIIKITDPGPILFVQKRVGRDGNFNFIKFRTMKLEYCTGSRYGGEKAEKIREQLVKTKNESSGPMFKMKDDPRVSRIGKFLRKTSLDEIPQFYNVLRGDMSIVGPRPPLPAEVAKYTREEKKRIIGVKPGITGLWQVSGRSDIQFDEWVKLDAYYIENWSLLLDLIIIFKTIIVIVFRKGAY